MDITGEIKGLIDSKQYKEIIILMDQALAREESSDYYFYRAYARYESKSGNYEQNIKLILDDLNQAIAFDNDEDSLYLRFTVLGDYINYLPNTLDLGYDSSIKSITHDGEIQFEEFSYEDDPDYIAHKDKITEEIEKYKALRGESLDKLIELYPTAKYYAIKHFYCHQDRLENIEKACELDPQYQYFVRKAEIEIEAGLYEQALNSVLRAKELSNGKIDADLTYKHARLLIILGDNDTAESVIKELVHIKDDNSGHLNKPVLLTKGNYNRQGYYGIELLYLADKVDEYAKLLSEYYKENPDWVSLELMHVLFEGDNHDIFLKYFNYNDHQNQSILFMNICALLSINEVSSAEELINNLNGIELYQECIDIDLSPLIEEKINETTRMKIPEQPSYFAYNYIDFLFSLIRFDKLGVNIFIDIVNAILFKKDRIRLYQIYEGVLFRFNENDRVKDNELKADVLQSELNKALRRMKLMQAFLHELPFLRSKDSTKVIILQNRLELALSKYIIMETDKIEADAREAERREMMNRLAHNIKGIVSSISFPLERMKRDLPEKARKLDEAIRGSNLIREMVNTINYSYNTKVEHINYDIVHASEASASLYDMLITSLRDSITNILYDKHFAQYKDQYFSSSEVHDQAINEWETVFIKPTLDEIHNFTSKHLFALESSIDLVKKYKVGNDMGSFLKLSMMFLEIVSNAVKYSAYVPKHERKVNISFDDSGSNLIFNVSNKFNPDIKAISTGIGHFIINNYSQVLGCKPDIQIENQIYSLTMKFTNYWR